MNQSQIALEVSRLLLMQNQVLHQWQYKDNVYAIYGKTQTDLELIKSVCERLSGATINQKCRQSKIITAKRLFIFMAFATMKNNKLMKIARYIGLTSHATVIHHRKKMQEYIEVNDYYFTELIIKCCNHLGLHFIKTKEVDNG